MTYLLHATDATKVGKGLGGCTTIKQYAINLYETQFLLRKVPTQSFDFCVITSQRTVQWILNHTEWSTFIQNLPLFVVGVHTGEMCKEIGWNVSRVSPSGFVDLLPSVSSGCGLFIGANEPSFPVQEWLRDSGNVHVSSYTFERIVHLPTIDWTLVSVVLATSPKIATCFIELGLPKHIPIVVLGNLTKETILSLGDYRVFCSPTPTISSTVSWISQVMERNIL